MLLNVHCSVQVITGTKNDTRSTELKLSTGESVDCFATSQSEYVISCYLKPMQLFGGKVHCDYPGAIEHMKCHGVQVYT